MQNIVKGVRRAAAEALSSILEPSLHAQRFSTAHPVAVRAFCKLCHTQSAAKLLTVILALPVCKCVKGLLLLLLWLHLRHFHLCMRFNE